MADKKVKRWRTVVASVFALLGILVIPGYFLAPLPSGAEQVPLEVLPNLNIRSSGSFENLTYPEDVPFDEFKKLAESGRPFLEVSIIRRCISRNKRGGCTAHNDEEEVAARYSMLSPKEDGSWVVSFPEIKFAENESWYESWFAWDIAYDDDEVAFTRSPLHLIWWRVLIFFLGFLVVAAVVKWGARETSEFLRDLPETPKPKRTR